MASLKQYLSKLDHPENASGLEPAGAEMKSEVLAAFKQLEAALESLQQQVRRRFDQDPHKDGEIINENTSEGVLRLSRNTPRNLDEIEKWAADQARGAAELESASAELFRDLDQSLATRTTVNKAAESQVVIRNGFDSRESAGQPVGPVKTLRGINI